MPDLSPYAASVLATIRKRGWISLSSLPLSAAHVADELVDAGLAELVDVTSRAGGFTIKRLVAVKT